MTRTRHALVFTLLACALSAPAPRAQVKAQLPANVAPPWNKGIQPISRESYWNAVECGKQGGAGVVSRQEVEIRRAVP